MPTARVAMPARSTRSRRASSVLAAGGGWPVIVRRSSAPDAPTLARPVQRISRGERVESRPSVTPIPPIDPRALAEEVARLRAQLDDLQAAAAAARRVKAQFLANMSHELRTPMNGVLGMADLLSDAALTSEQREYVDVLTSSVRSLLRVDR